MVEGRLVHHVRIRGRVQGVGFRAWVAQMADRLGLDGWVRNRRDGSVEAVFAGPPERVEAAVAACRQGPPLARVEDVEMLQTADDPGRGFLVLPTV